MLQITIPEREFYSDIKNEFITIESRTIQLEHSLISISKWESKWKKPFFSMENKPLPEAVDYVRCMTLTQNVPLTAYAGVTQSILNEVNAYIDDPMSATTFGKIAGAASREVITSELIYYWMVAYGIPFECQKWHLNRLITLIKICDIRQGPQRKMSKRETMMQYTSLNAARKQRYKTRG